MNWVAVGLIFLFLFFAIFEEIEKRRLLQEEEDLEYDYFRFEDEEKIPSKKENSETKEDPKNDA